MKPSRKKLSAVLGLVALGSIAGTLVWEVLERLLAAAGVALDLSIGPVSVDLHAVSIAVRPNPGSVLGLAAGALLARIA